MRPATLVITDVDLLSIGDKILIVVIDKYCIFSVVSFRFGFDSLDSGICWCMVDNIDRVVK
jgi:hypothetical protein